MREHRFKVWDKERKVMSEPFGFGDLYGYEGELNAVTLHHPYTSVGQDFDICQHRGGVALAYPQVAVEDGVNKNLVFLESIGLHDKNGKEICEGDIFGGIWQGCYIAWCDKCKSLQCFLAFDEGCQACSGDAHWGEIVEDDGKLEVIGNIYENPELLEPK